MTKIKEYGGQIAEQTRNAMAFESRADADVIIGGENLGHYVERQLEHVTAQVFEAKVPSISALEFIALDESVPEGAEVYVDRAYATSGEPEFITNMADDLPTMEVYGSETPRKIHAYGAAYNYGVLEIANQRFSGQDINARKALNVRNRMLRFHAKIAWLGSKAQGLEGALTHRHIPRVQSALDFGSASAAQIEDGIHGWANALSEESEGVETGSLTLVLPRRQFNQLQTRRYGTDSSDTVSSILLRNSSYISAIRPADELKGVLKGGKDAAFLTPAGDEDAIRYVAPVMLRTMMPQLTNLSWHVPMYALTGGVACRAPKRSRVIELTA